MNLAKKILIGLFLGLVVGLVLNIFAPGIFPYADEYLLSPLGKIFINLIRMLVVPLVFFSLVLGITGLGDPKKLGRIGIKTVTYFIGTTAMAIILAITLAYVIKPGHVGDLQIDYDKEAVATAEAPSFIDNLVNMIPSNPVQAFVEANMLQIIVFAIFVGIGITALGKKVEGVKRVIEQGNDIMMYLVNLVMKFAPYGAFGLLASAVGKEGFDAIGAMALYMFVIVLGLVLHTFIVYGGTLALVKRNPFTFFKEFFPAMTVGFSTGSSVASLPVAMDIAQNKLRIPKSISSFVQPLGANINMDGTAIMQGVATIFIAQIVGADLTVAQLVTVVLTAVLASIGTASVPSAGLIMLAMVLTSVNLPVEGIALIIGVDRLLDMLRTAVNLTGDAVCAAYVAETEQKRDAKQAIKSGEGLTIS